LADPASPIPRHEALALIEESARTLVAQLAFSRVAFGMGEDPIASAELEALARPMFEHVRPTLVWAVDAQALPGVAARILLNFVQLAGAALATGGEVRASATTVDRGWGIVVEASGPRARLHPEVEAGLEGHPRGDGLAGRWAQGAFVQAIAVAAGAAIWVEAEDQAVRFKASWSA
jgi:histidine phosphotransferase ChpT